MENHANQHYKNQFIISCFSLLLLCSFWQTANAQWSNIGPGSSGYVTTLVIDPVNSTTLYTGVSNGGIFKSTDSGANWVHSSTGLSDGLNDLFVQVANDGHSDFQVQALTIDPTTPSTLYAGIAYAGISKSTDGGTSWSTINTGLLTGNSIDVRTIAINPSTSSTLYAGTAGEGVFKSTDGGSNWSTVNTGISDLNINTLAIDSSNPNTLYAGTNNGVFKSTDSGANWNTSSTGLSDPGARTIIIDPSNPIILYTATASGIFKSIDAGANWSAFNTGLSTLDVITLVIDSNNPSTLYAGTNNGLFKSSNGGTSWNISSTGLPPSLHGDWVQTLAIDPTTSSTVYAGTYDSGIFKSIDSGTNWSISSAGLVNYDIHALAIDPVSPSIIYAGAYGDGIFKSTDDGSTWSNSSTGLSPSFYGLDVQTLAIDPVSSATLYAGTYGGIYKSTDSGANWSQITSSLLISDILDVRTIVIDPITPSTLYAVTKDTGNYLIKSTDSGGSWTTIDTGLSTPIYTLAIDPTTPSTLYAGSLGYAGTTINGVLRSTDGGTSWSGRMYIAELFLFNDLEVHTLVVDPITPSTLYADNGVGIYKSTNSGASWGISDSGLAFSGWWYDMTIDPSIPSTIYASNRLSGGIFKSTNSGVSWTSINNGLNNLNVTSLAINPATHALYAGTHANSVYKYNLDIIPDGLIFTDSSNVPLNTLITSETLSITGIEVDVDITITGGEYSLNSGTFTAAAGTATNGDTLQLRTISSDSYNTTTNVVVSVGTGGDTWSLTTLIDTMPDAFSFIDQIGVLHNTLTTSDTITISGLGASSAISITGGEYSINGGAYTSIGSFVNNNDTVAVRTTSSASFNTAADVVLTIGGVSDTFTVTTEADTDGDGIGNSLDTNDDNDGYLDTVDNCILVANNQLDVDGDGYGNACDADFNNDGISNSLDLGLFKTAFFSTGALPTDINGDNIVNSLDLGLFKKQFGAPPGPSGTAP